MKKYRFDCSYSNTVVFSFLKINMTNYILGRFIFFCPSFKQKKLKKGIFFKISEIFSENKI